LKEFVDHALDACETTGFAPVIGIEIPGENDLLCITVEDNGQGIAPESMYRILKFQTRTSDKAAYRSPMRGAQGNALKTVLGLPCALGLRELVLIEAPGVQHRILAWVDPAGELRLDYDEAAIPVRPSICITLPLIADGQEFYPPFWAQALDPKLSVLLQELSDEATAALRAKVVERIAGQG
jgi:hypothetical protein